MNWRKFVPPGCVVACVFAASTATAQMTGQGNSMSRMGMRGAFTPRSIARMPMHRAPMLGSMGRIPMHRAPMMNSALGLRRFNRFNDGDFDRDDRFRRFDRFNEIIFISVFGFPWWWGPWAGWNWGYYPYESYGYSEYSYPSASGYDYGYGYPSGSYTAAITAARITEMTMKVLCAMFSPNTQFLGTAMTRPPWVVSSLKTVTT
jgi:hypothetical protein